MSNKHLATYIMDHFAGSEGALAILDHIEKVHGGAAGAMALLALLRLHLPHERRIIDLMITICPSLT